MNQVTLIGHVGKDGELKYTQNGIAMLSFSLATTERWNDESGVKKEKTEWHKCAAWRKVAESVAPVAKKGARLIVVGKLATRSWEKDGKKQYMTEIIVEQAASPTIGDAENKPAANSGNW